MVEWAFIRSAASDNNGSYGLNIEGQKIAPGTPVIAWAWQGGADNELWEINDDGSVLSALGTGLYLAPSQDASSLVTSVTPYYWTFNADGSIATTDGNLVTVDPNQSLEGALVQLAAAQAGPPVAQQWWAAPNMQIVPQQFTAWRFITSTVTDADKTTFVLTADGTSQQLGANAVVSEIQANASNAVWQITSDGRILSAMNRATLLGVSLAASGNNPVVTQSATALNNSQNWTFESSGLIANSANGLYLGIDGQPATLSPATSPQALALPLPSGSVPSSFIWQLTPTSPLLAIVAQSPTPFRAFADSELAVYDFLGQLVGATQDIRSAYTNLSVSISDWKSTIDSTSPPNGYDLTAWYTVVGLLNSEFTAVDSVRDFFGQYDAYVSLLSNSCSDLLNQLGGLAGLEQGSSTSVGGLVLSIFEGILYTALEAVPGGAEAVSLASVVGNVMEGAINVATNAANVETAISTDPFEVAYADLWGLLGSALSATSDASDLMRTIILSDYAKSQAFYTAATGGGPNALSWPSDQSSTLVDNSKPGFEISVLQLLLPAKFQIYRYKDTDNSPVKGVPAEFQWVTAGDGDKWVKFWIGAQDNWEAYPSPGLLQTYLWSTGIEPWDFFYSWNGWGFAIAEWTGIWGTTASDNALMTICNQTPNVLSIAVQMTEGIDIGFAWPGLPTMAPYGSSTSETQTKSGVTGLSAIYTITEVSGGTVVASFALNMNPSGTSAGDVTIASPTTAAGYSLSSPICLSGDVGDGYSGAAQITVSWSSS